MPRHLLRAAPEYACAVHIKDFIVPATVGSVVGLGAGFLARRVMDGEHSATKDAAAYVVNTAVFLLVGGLMFVLRQRRPHG